MGQFVDFTALYPASRIEQPKRYYAYMRVNCAVQSFEIAIDKVKT